MDRKSPPARADLDDPLAGLELQLPADGLELARRGRRQRVLGPLPERRGVHEILREEEAEELAPQVVMGGDVATAARARVAPRGLPSAQRHGTEPRKAALEPIEQLAIAQQQAHQSDERLSRALRAELAAAPQSLHVCRARPHRAAAGDFAVEGRIEHLDARNRRAAGLAE